MKALFLLFLALVATPASAYFVEALPSPTDSDQFVVGPTKTELLMKPGESRVINLKVSNLTGDLRTFIMEAEDFAASTEPATAVRLLGSDRGPYSLRDYITVPERTFVLKQGERATVPVTVRVPYDAEPGGLYGAAIVSMQPLPAEQRQGDVVNQTPIVKRIGSLFYVRVAGPVKEDASLVDFGTVGHRVIFTDGPINLNILVENRGSIHIIPEGTISLSNLFGETVDTIATDKWFVMPASTRLRELSTSREILFGRYQADLVLKLYGDKIENRSIVFWVIPWKVILMVILAVVVLYAIIRWVGKNFQIKRKV